MRPIVEKSPTPFPPNTMLAISVPLSAIPSRSLWMVYPLAGSVCR